MRTNPNWNLKGSGRKPEGYVNPYTAVDGSKLCKACGVTKPVGAFGIDRSKIDGRTLKCGSCCRSARQARYIPRPKKSPPPILKTKTCAKCGVEKTTAEFGKSSTTYDGKHKQCIDCVRDYATKYRTSKGWRRATKPSKLVTHLNGRVLSKQYTGTDVCLIVFADHYRRFAHLLDEYGTVLPGYESDYAAFITAVKRGYVDTHKVPKTVVPKSDQLARGVSLETIFFNRVRNRIRKVAKHRGVPVDESFTNRGGRSVTVFFKEQFGYSVEDLIAHVEEQFAPGMNWTQFSLGNIHLDHKSPFAIFDVSDPAQLRHCFALSNLQPLWASDNSRKSSVCDLSGVKMRVGF